MFCLSVHLSIYTYIFNALPYRDVKNLFMLQNGNNPTLYFSRSAKTSCKNKMKIVMYNISVSDTMSAMRQHSKHSNNVTTSLEGWEFNTSVCFGYSNSLNFNSVNISKHWQINLAILFLVLRIKLALTVLINRIVVYVPLDTHIKNKHNKADFWCSIHVSPVNLNSAALSL